MTQKTGNLSDAERIISALLGVGLSVLALRRGSVLSRVAAGVAGTALLARAGAGHCAVKAVMSGETSLREGLSDQWQRLTGNAAELRDPHTGSGNDTARSRAVDQSVEDSFPASDPPASRLPDEPPVNAEAKWAAAGGRRS
jgi:hypothetical protein